MLLMKIALLFPGQGSQYIGMCKQLFNDYKIVQDIYEEASQALNSDLRKLCFEGTLEEITKTEVAQPTILTASYAMYQVYKEQLGLDPAFMAGHSLGEYSALTCSGAISLYDAVKLVQSRGNIINEAAKRGNYTMAAVMDIDEDIIQKECAKASVDDAFVAIANYNTQNQRVISGHRQAVENVSHVLKEMGARVIELNTRLPFHSVLLEQASVNFKEELDKYCIVNPLYQVISNVTALPYNNSEEIKKLLPIHISKSVKWKDSIDYMIQQNVTMFLEMGPGNKMRNMIGNNWEGVSSYTLDLSKDIKEFKNVYFNRTRENEAPREDYGALVTKCLVEAISTKNQNWDNEEYEKGVLVPYRTIQSLQNNIDNTGIQPTMEQAKECLGLLKLIFKTKRVPVEEQKERLNSILCDTNTYEVFVEAII